ncbi:hypothetical protein [uncultured Anaerococcus sp.]|uniref:hypothetical protein n=1 Tax=uncultured Anaerococcus sp. TaxID=293428 RepID=UPI002804A3B9|nr:hypothetical protein [uncultured Anaerococcus sp.]
MDFKIKRMDNGIYSIKTKIEGMSKEELEEVFKEVVEKTKWWNGEHCKDNIWSGFRKGKIK